jgi:hypothetical protein
MWNREMVADLVASENQHVHRGVGEAADKDTAHYTCVERDPGQSDDMAVRTREVQVRRG